jgi:hypothetical protein
MASKKLADAETMVGGLYASGAGAIASNVQAGALGVEAVKPALDDARAANDAANVSADRIHAAGNNVVRAAEELNPIIAATRGDAATLRTRGQDLTKEAQPWLTSSRDMLGMNRDAEGSAGEYWKLYDQLDPDLQMALAASDARNESAAQTESAVRSLTRAGVSPSASAIGALRARLTQQTAALVSSVKTKARQAGVQLQLGTLEAGLKLAMQQAGVGEAFMRDSVTATGAASDAEGRAGSLTATKGDLYGKGGALEASAADIRLSGANTEAQAASVLQRAYESWGNSYTTAAEFYSTQASSFLGLIQSGARADNIGRLMGGVTKLV